MIVKFQYTIICINSDSDISIYKYISQLLREKLKFGVPKKTVGYMFRVHFNCENTGLFKLVLLVAQGVWISSDEEDKISRKVSRNLNKNNDEVLGPNS